MFQWLWSKVSQFFNAMYITVKDQLLNPMWTFMTTAWVWVVGLVTIIVGSVTTLLTSVYNIFATMMTKLTEITTPNSNVSQSVGDMLSVANTFAPVQEGFGILVLLCGLWVIMLTYRFIKSLIPTLA